MTLTARLAAGQDPEIGSELIIVEHPDGRTEELILHDYDRLYALPGVYETIVHERLECISPAVVAELLADAADRLGRPRADERVLDVAAGNGVSGEALAAVGLTPVFGSDIVPSARDAALRDRPGVYRHGYETLDIAALTAAQRDRLAALEATALTCVTPVGPVEGQVPPAGLTALAALLSDDALIAYLHDPRWGPDVVDAATFGPDATAERISGRERYRHRRTVGDGVYEMSAAVWRVRRRPRVTA